LLVNYGILAEMAKRLHHWMFEYLQYSRKWKQVTTQTKFLLHNRSYSKRKVYQLIEILW